MSTSQKNTALIIASLILVFLSFIWNIPNVDLLRQGTEGFYLQISKEMFETNNWLTPFHRGEPHWSKPPLHFWSAMTLYSLLGASKIWLARLSVAICGLLGIVFISRFTNKYFNIPQPLAILFFGSSLAFVKYSKIYMMEIPLTVYSILACVLFYEFQDKKSLLVFVLATLFLSAAILIKGPVALVMIAGGFCLYFTISHFLDKHSRINISSTVLFFMLGTLLASSWFIISFSHYGFDFINYFFIRENFGKFTAVSYPISSILKGLLVYSLPWIIFLPLAFIKFSKKLHHDPFRFVLSQFIFFFALWHLPKQRSLHYAIPAIPFLLIIILAACHSYINRFNSPFRNWSFIFASTAAISVTFTIFLLAAISLLFVEFQSSTHLTAVLILLITSVCLYLSFYKRNFTTIVLSFFIWMNILWNFILPSFSLPILPQNIVEQINDCPIAATVTKPYFFAEVLGRSSGEIIKLELYEITWFMDQKNENYLYIMPEEYAKLPEIQKRGGIIATWPQWKNSNRITDLFQAMREHNLSLLKTNLVLVRPY